MSSNVKDSSILKNLQSQLSRLEGEFESLKMQQNDIAVNIQHKKKHIEEVKNKIKQLQSNKKKALVVSEHAILRYLERVENIDINSIIEKISTDKLKEMADVLGNGTFPVNGFSAKVIDNVVVTVII